MKLLIIFLVIELAILGNQLILIKKHLNNILKKN